MDSYSKWIEIWFMKKTDANSVIEKLRMFFIVFGLAFEIVSDNGPPFNSAIFEEFGRINGIQITKSPPYHPESNGLAERAVQTAKSSFKKSIIDHKWKNLSIDKMIENFLISYRNTISTSTGCTPASLMFCFRPRTLLDIISEKSERKTPIFLEKGKEGTDIKTLINIDDNNKSFVTGKEYIVGEPILYRNHFKEYVKWIPGKIVSRLSAVLYKVFINNAIRICHRDQ